ncbi:hypothetical protein [Maritimibacter sp. HL-12]|uniref:hypothetical protein n=1 Tax=Maritimibacter sp. HL-12 TaxID=1162418 RepID=UPI000A0F2093|nr:hypothetical protein [Maritimibacter sp. HL-12]SMH47789.1 hypothetical protein SAMN05661107_1894 [Maritimibacter sp. HL-12]
MVIIIVSIVTGFAIGCFVNYAVTFHTGQARNIAVCIGGAVVGGALIPWLLSVSSLAAAIVGAAIGAAIVLYVMFRMSLTA